MVGSEAGEMQSDTVASGFNDNKAEEFTGEEENPTPPSPMDDTLDDMEETAENLFFSDEDYTFPSLADFPYISSPSASPSLSSVASTLAKPVPYFSTKSSSTTFSETDAMQQPPLPAAAVESEDRLVPVDAGFDFVGDEIDIWETCSEEPMESKWDPSSFSGETAAEEKVGFLCGREGCSSEDLASVFLDWLKRNKDAISPEDLKSIKLKRSTIECASRRLGGGKQGRVQLLKLILAWVQNHHLQKGRRRSRGSEATGRGREYNNYRSPPPNNANLPFTQEATTFNPNIDFSYGAVPGNSWMPYTGESSYPPVMPGYRSEAVPPYHFYQDQPFSAEPWQQGLSPAVDYSPAAAQYFPVYYPGLMASATKEARRKRMALHRRSPSLHHHRSQQQQQNKQQQSSDTVIEESSSAHSNANKDNSSNRSFLSTLPADIPSLSPAAVAPSPPMAQMQEESYLHRHTSLAGDRRRDDAQEGIKADKNYRFLLQKVLKQSDVGSLGRIVLPKKEAEINLPELDARDGISIEMEDIGTSRTWNMRYRFWPNNKSRMYLLENTGGFVRSNGLQEGDFIVIYSDVKCGKYMIRGVKVRRTVDVIKEGINKNSGKATQKKKKNSSTMAVRQLLDEKGKSLYALGN